MQSKAFNRISASIAALACLAAVAFVFKSLAGSVPAPSPLPTEAAPAPSEDVSAALPSPESLSIEPIKAPRGTIRAFVASTSDEQEKGLGDRASLPADEGMLFPFAAPGDYGFWMKDMRFDLDMVWISADKRVAGVARGVRADSYPEVVYPPSPISYVLELDAGRAAELGIATGTRLVF
ncbi:MAG: DUF192 domain-containing protein [Patescibacteria group bacterium]|nr:DUF192 domain-containing protein [Patescibacteria group bacterium]